MPSSIPAVDGTEIIIGASRSPLWVQFEVIELRVISGPDVGQEVSLGLPSVRIGTASDNDLVLTDRAISRRHAEIRMTPEGLLLRDLGSTNGTFINDVRITEAYVPEHAECRLGYTRLSVRRHTEERKVAVPRQDHLGELVGASERMRELYGLIRAVAPTPTTVHLHGESGAGKELVARTLHALSNRPGPLVVFDASITDPEMVRNDLFGHIKGAFTGATGSRDGAFRQAHTGTLFIDEIGELPLDLQPRLLR
ncbi:MAG TPA: FHA domain-containing protein, partial [Candidatus Competibacter sp.]|nr:FHA domain-containing protein [Candidatus Competibacter sp.]